MLLPDPLHPFVLSPASELAVDTRRKTEVVTGVAFTELPRSSSQLELLCRVVADGLEHPEAIVRASEQALVEQRLQRVQVGVAHLFGGFERAAAREHRHAGKQLLLFG